MTLLTTFLIQISYKWYLFGKPECLAIGFWNEIGDDNIWGLMALDIERPDLYGGPCTGFQSSKQLRKYICKKGQIAE